MEEMDTFFESASADAVISNKLRFVDLNWPRAAAAAARVVKPGGRISMNVWCQGQEEEELAAAFVGAGFKSVKVSGSGPGTMLTATR